MLHRNILALLLLMMTSTAWADTKTLYFMGATHNDYCIGSHLGTLFKSPQQAQRTCGFKDYDLVGPSANGDYGLAKNGTTWFSIYAKTQSCELKDIPGKGTNGAHNIGFRGDKAPKMVRRCINNCEVEDRRVSKYGESRDNDYGGAVCVELGSGEKLNCFADYTRIQTGAVCTQQPGEKDDTKYDDVTANPGDDNGNSADQAGTDGDGTKDKPDNPGQPPKQDGRDEGSSDGGRPGSDGGGNQNGGQGGTGADSPRDSGSADDPVEDKDKDKNKDKDKPGKGKGKGGGGGGNHGDKDKADDGKGGDPKGGEGKGDGKGDGKDGGKDGKDGGKDGKDGENGSPNGMDNGTGAGGDKDGKGSGISGGDCKTGKAPQCKGET